MLAVVMSDRCERSRKAGSWLLVGSGLLVALLAGACAEEASPARAPTGPAGGKADSLQDCTAEEVFCSNTGECVKRPADGESLCTACDTEYEAEPGFFSDCGGFCSALQFDRENCSACGVQCADGYVCQEGGCVEDSYPWSQQVEVAVDGECLRLVPYQLDHGGAALAGDQWGHPTEEGTALDCEVTIIRTYPAGWTFDTPVPVRLQAYMEIPGAGTADLSLSATVAGVTAQDAIVKSGPVTDSGDVEITVDPGASGAAPACGATSDRTTLRIKGNVVGQDALFSIDSVSHDIDWRRCQ